MPGPRGCEDPLPFCVVSSVSSICNKVTGDNSKANPGRLYLEATVVRKGGPEMTVVYTTVHAL